MINLELINPLNRTFFSLGISRTFSTWAVLGQIMRSLARGSVMTAHLEHRCSSETMARSLTWKAWWNWWGLLLVKLIHVYNQEITKLVVAFNLLQSRQNFVISQRTAKSGRSLQRFITHAHNYYFLIKPHVFLVHDVTLMRLLECLTTGVSFSGSESLLNLVLLPHFR